MHSDSLQSPSVSIDGEAIRRIREENRLTQLYVSKVVGVTTDTVSRWENNRYPTIRRDNALKLAEALEVDLDKILKQEEALVEECAPADERPKRKFWPFVLLGFVLVLVAGGMFFRKEAVPVPVMQAQRLLPPYAAPGSRILIRVKISSEKPLKGMILREDFPQGWKLVEANPPASSLDNLTGMARWIFRKPELATTVSYILEVAKEVTPGAVIAWQGELIANPDGHRSAIALETIGQMVINPLHWADSNGNRVIEDLEILEVSELLDETGRLHLEWDLLEEIWDAGGYEWQADKNRFVPLRVNSSPQAEQ